MVDELDKRIITELTRDGKAIADPSGEGIWFRDGNKIFHSLTKETTSPDGEGPPRKVIETLSQGLITADRGGALPLLAQYRAAFGLGQR